MKFNKILGLSLIEMLVSLALMAIMAVILASTLDFGRQAWVRSQQLSTLEEQALSRHDLRIWLENFDRKLTFKGDASGFRFTHWPQNPPHPKAFEYVVNLTRERHGVSDDLVLTISSTDEYGQAKFSANRTMARDLIGVTIRYFGRTEASHRSVWHDDWDFATGRLELVKIEGTRTNGKPWPPFTVRVGSITDSKIVDVREPRPKD